MVDGDDQTTHEKMPAVLAYFRDEMRRATAWRDRLDRTTNWAVVVTASLLTWTFSKVENPHFVILIALLSVTYFWQLEAGRYRRYDVWRSRVRLIEREFIAPYLSSTCCGRSDRWERLAKDLVEPTYKVPLREALQRRLRRTYGFLIFLLLLAWVLKVSRYSDAGTFTERAAIGSIPGGWFVAGVAAYTSAVVVLLLWPLGRRAMEEIAEGESESEVWREKTSHT